MRLRRLRGELRQDAGASAVEYGLILVAVAAVIVVVLWAFGGIVTGLFQDSCDTIKTTSQSTASCGA